jgi:hypothetical protein
MHKEHIQTLKAFFIENPKAEAALLTSWGEVYSMRAMSLVQSICRHKNLRYKLFTRASVLKKTRTSAI